MKKTETKLAKEWRQAYEDMFDEWDELKKKYEQMWFALGEILKEYDNGNLRDSTITQGKEEYHLAAKELACPNPSNQK